MVRLLGGQMTTSAPEATPPPPRVLQSLHLSGSNSAFYPKALHSLPSLQLHHSTQFLSPQPGVMQALL